MDPTILPVSAGTKLEVTCTLYKARGANTNDVIVLHHGICHSGEHFLPLISHIRALGIHVAMIDQQSKRGDWLRNLIGVGQYREGMKVALQAIENHALHAIEDDKERSAKKLRVACHAFHSMGAFIGEELRIQDPDLGRPTVLMAPVPPRGAGPITLRIFKRRPIAYLKACLVLDIRSLVRKPKHVRKLFFAADTDSEFVEQATKALRHAPFWIYCQMVLRPIVRPKVSDDGEPKLLLRSNEDEIFRPHEYDAMKERYSSLEEIRISGGHDFFIVNSEATAKSIVDFYHSRCDKTKQVRSRTEGAQPEVPMPHISVKPERAKPEGQTEGTTG